MEQKIFKYNKKLCEYCKKPFNPKSGHSKFCDRQHYVTCPECGKTRKLPKDKIWYVIKNGPSACSYECRAKRTAQTSMEKYGCKAPGNNPEARKKASETMMMNLGVPYAMMSKEVQEKSKETLMKIYGVDNVGKAEVVIKKRQQTNREKYGDVMPFNRPECYEKQHKTIEERYGVKYASLIPYVAATNNHVSKINLKFKDKLEKYGCITSTEYTVQTLIYDLHVENSNTLIEINPTYTHNAIGNHWNPNGLNKYYHRDKTQLAIDNGYKCVHVWDWDNKDIIARMLAPKIHISCNELRLYKLNLDVTNEFLDKNHYIGRCRGQLLCLGLVNGGEIYQVMTFGKPKFDKSHMVQLYRMCTKLGYEVDGGYDMLSKFASEFGLYDIVAYADFSKTDGSELESIGMKLDHITPPRLIWSKGKQYINSSLIVSGRSKYHSDEDLLNDGWLPIYDCGQRVYVC